MKRAGCVILAGIMAAGMCVGLAGCKDETEAFYTLQIAYWENIITYDDLKMLNEKIESGEKVTLSQETQEAIKDEIIENIDHFGGIGPSLYYCPTFDTKDMIEQLKEWNKTIEYQIPDKEEMECLNYYGEYHGCHFLLLKTDEPELESVPEMKLGDITFQVITGKGYFIWTNPNHIEITFEENGGASL